MINVAYVFDKNFADPAIVSIVSAIKNNKEQSICFHLVTFRDNNEKLEIINNEIIEQKQIVKNYIIDKSKIEWRSGTVMESRNHSNVNAPFSNAAYLKLTLPEIISEDKIIFIDSDTLVGKCLWDLFNINLQESFVGGVPDDGVHSYLKDENDLFGYKHKDYLNTGVLLMDLKKLRAMSFFKECEIAHQKYNDRLKFGDQDLLNLVLVSKKLVLPQRFNIFAKFSESKNSVAQKIECLDDSILHFIGDIKPWQSWNLPPFCELWMQYANLVSNKKIELTPITNLSQILKQAQLLHSYGDYQTASSVKSRAINILMRELNKSSKTS